MRKKSFSLSEKEYEMLELAYLYEGLKAFDEEINYKKIATFDRTDNVITNRIYFVKSIEFKEKEVIVETKYSTITFKEPSSYFVKIANMNDREFTEDDFIYKKGDE